MVAAVVSTAVAQQKTPLACDTLHWIVTVGVGVHCVELFFCLIRYSVAMGPFEMAQLSAVSAVFVSASGFDPSLVGDVTLRSDGFVEVASVQLGASGAFSCGVSVCLC